MTPATVDAGYSMVMMPRISDDGGIWLFFANRITDLKSLLPQTSNGVTIQLPTQTEQSSIQEFEVKSGSTLVVAGVAENTDRANANGVGSPWLPLLGGGVSGSRVKKRIVYMFTPIEVDTMGMPTQPIASAK